MSPDSTGRLRRWAQTIRPGLGEPSAAHHSVLQAAGGSPAAPPLMACLICLWADMLQNIRSRLDLATVARGRCSARPGDHRAGLASCQCDAMTLLRRCCDAAVKQQ